MGRDELRLTSACLCAGTTSAFVVGSSTVVPEQGLSSTEGGITARKPFCKKPPMSTTALTGKSAHSGSQQRKPALSAVER